MPSDVQKTVLPNGSLDDYFVYFCNAQKTTSDIRAFTKREWSKYKMCMLNGYNNNYCVLLVL